LKRYHFSYSPRRPVPRLFVFLVIPSPHFHVSSVSLSFFPGLARQAKLSHNAPFGLPTKTDQEII
jgi:hypothetical protein